MFVSFASIGCVQSHVPHMIVSAEHILLRQRIQFPLHLCSCRTVGVLQIYSIDFGTVAGQVIRRIGRDFLGMKRFNLPDQTVIQTIRSVHLNIVKKPADSSSGRLPADLHQRFFFSFGIPDSYGMILPSFRRIIGRCVRVKGPVRNIDPLQLVFLVQVL